MEELRTQEGAKVREQVCCYLKTIKDDVLSMKTDYNIWLNNGDYKIFTVMCF